MRREKIIESIRRGGSIPADVVEELHQLIREHGPRGAKPAIPAWQYRASSLAIVQTIDEEQRCRIDDSVLEEMYRHYISENKKPILTFREYAAMVKNITGLHAA